MDNKFISVILNKNNNKAIFWITLLILSVIFALINIFCIQLSPAIGYIIGVYVAGFFLRSGREKVFLMSLTISAAAILLFDIISFFIMFLSQTELYTIFEFVGQSLTLENCIFTFVLGTLLAAFGIYSLIPSKKKKEIPSDF